MGFDLNKSISAWRRSLRFSKMFLRDDVDELEAHLRDHIEHRVEQGKTEQEAYEEALRRLGNRYDLETEYSKVRWGRLRRKYHISRSFFWETYMLKNYLKIALRSMRRHPGYTLINIFGLAVGMACCLLIGLYVKDELSFDRFHEHADRLYTLSSHFEGPFGGTSPATPFPLASTLTSDLPEVERAVRTTFADQNVPVIREGTLHRSDRRVLLTEPTFFEAFSFPEVAGDPVTALGVRDGAAITESMVRDYFGDENPVGQELKIRLFDAEHNVTVRAVIRDVPSNSTIQFDLIAPITLLGPESTREDSWQRLMYRTYVVTKDATSADVLNEKIADVITRRLAEEDQSSIEFTATPLPAVYLSKLHHVGGFKGQYKYLYIFGSVAVFVLLIAAANYVNLVTAQSKQRFREVGVRKSLGATRFQLTRQFLTESMLMSITALFLALLLTILVLPAFNLLFDKSLTFEKGEYGIVLLLLCVFMLLVVLAAGMFPAFVLSRFRPSDVLRGAGTQVGFAQGRILHKGLVVLQFTISVVLITGTATIYKQLAYVQSKDLGFQGEQVVVIDLPEGLPELARETLKQETDSQPGVLSASTANGLPSRFQIALSERADRLSVEARTKEEMLFQLADVDFDFIRTLELELVTGRGFSDAYASDLTRAYVINETAAQKLGWSPREAIGKTFKTADDMPEGEVIGVVKDFHTVSLHQKIVPVALQLRRDAWSNSTPYFLIARLNSEDIQESLQNIKTQYTKRAAGEPFKYEFLDDRFDAMYRSEEQLSQIFSSFAALAIFIACLGLFGLAAYAAESRTKEVGIRKVMGASVTNIIALLSKDFIKLVLFAFVVAAPIAYFAAEKWLQDFAYRIDLGWGVFMVAGALAFIIALLTVSYQAIRAALADPVKSLRYE